MDGRPCPARTADGYRILDRVAPAAKLSLSPMSGRRARAREAVGGLPLTPVAMNAPGRYADLSPTLAIMDNIDLQILRQVTAWRKAGHRVALGTITRTWGPAPRPPARSVSPAPAKAFCV